MFALFDHLFGYINDLNDLRFLGVLNVIEPNRRFVDVNLNALGTFLRILGVQDEGSDTDDLVELRSI